MEGICPSLVSPDDHARALLYDTVILVPNLLFLIYLCWHAKRSYETLERNRSMIMTTYYCFVWTVCVCNVFRAAVQLLGTASNTSSHMFTWNLLWLITRFVMIMLEVSVVVFLLHGYVANSGVALRRTVAISAAIAGLDALIKIVYVWVLHIPLYTFAGEDASRIEDDMLWSKWGFWVAHTVAFSLVYLGLMLLPLTPWRDLLPAKDTFHQYVRVLFALNLMSAVGAIMIGSHEAAGYCIYGISNFLYYGFYPPLLYMAFLASFFQSEDVDLENYYYSEMSEAGFFDHGDGDDPYERLNP